MRFRVSELIVRIQKERDAHKANFDKAVEVYRQELLEVVEGYVARVKKGELVHILHHLPVPEEHTKDFDLILDMLKTTQDMDIEFNKSEFDSYVRGNWGWAASFTANTMSYVAKAK